MAASVLRDQDQLEGASNYVIWKARISLLLDEHDLKHFLDSVQAEPVDVAPLRAFKKNMAKAKQLILNLVKSHIVSHIYGKGTTKEMWDALATLYQGSSEQSKMFLEEKMQTTRMHKGERVDPFLSRLQENRDQLEVVGAAPQAIEMVRLAFNSVSKDYQAKLHETGKQKWVFGMGTGMKREPPKFWKQGNTIYIYIYIYMLEFILEFRTFKKCYVKS